MMTDQALSHDDVDKLLPWYANETLDEHERRSVGTHLEKCTACQDSLELLLSIKDAINDRRTIPMVPEPRIDDLLQQVDRIEHTAPVSTSPWIIAASLAVVAVATVLLFPVRIGDQTNPEFKTVTSADHSAQVGYVLNLRFAAATSMPERGTLLSEVGANVIVELEDGEFQVVIPMQAVSVKELETFTDELLRRPEVESARIVALQLPVEQDD